MGILNSWGRFAAHRRQASSHRYCASPETCAIPVGAGLPAMGCAAAPEDLADYRQSPDQR
ncbi:hypothetical protein D0894_01075 [Pseudomonas monteilii]|uniref:Uncharacterized protein n=1 Tax=Pseudomonas monteilii TaxID=76759 RepID=A0A399MG20_9PSED|nr:hypothetical protein D0894_01075 [Pseudomonas monteilii]